MTRKQEVGADPEPGDEDPFRHDANTAVVHRRAPAKKDTRSWCRGKAGRQHTLAIEVPPNNNRSRPCGWYERRYITERPIESYYHCTHVEMCTTCGKVFRRYWTWMSEPELSREECPNFTPLQAETTD